MIGTVDLGGGTLEYEVAGSGPSVVFLHPGLWDRRTWDDQFEVFAREYRVLRYDARGYGRSSRPVPGVPYSHVEDLVAVMDATDVGRAALIGCSMGGGTALEATLEHPQRISALVLVAPGVPGFESSPEEDAAYGDLEERFERAVAEGDLERAMELELEPWLTLGTDDEAGRRIREIAFDNVHEVTMDESGARRLDPPPATRLEEVAVPTLVLPADHDPPDMARLSRVLADGIPNARLVEIPETDHVLNVRRPEEFNRVVLEFLREVLE